MAIELDYPTGPSPYDLKREQVIDLVRKSSVNDWVFDEDESTYTLRTNLLVRAVQEPGDPCHTLYFGHLVVDRGVKVLSGKPDPDAAHESVGRYAAAVELA